MFILSGQPFSSCFCGARVAQSLVFCVRNENLVLSTFMTYHRSLIMSATIWAGTLLEALVFILILVHVTQSLVGCVVFAIYCSSFRPFHAGHYFDIRPFDIVFCYLIFGISFQFSYNLWSRTIEKNFQTTMCVNCINYYKFLLLYY